MIKRRDESGQAIVELAIILPLLILLVAGFLQIYMDIHAADVASQAARAAARMVSAEGYTDQGLVQQVVDRTFKHADVKMQSLVSSVSGNGGSSCSTGGTKYTITVTTKPPNLVPFIGNFIKNTLDPSITERAAAFSGQDWQSGLPGPTSVAPTTGDVQC